MSMVIDARGLSCPQPVILTLAKIQEAGSGELAVLVDTETARENVSRAASSKGWEVKDIRQEGDACRLVLTKG